MARESVRKMIDVVNVQKWSRPVRFKIDLPSMGIPTGSSPAVAHFGAVVDRASWHMVQEMRRAACSFLGPNGPLILSISHSHVNAYSIILDSVSGGDSIPYRGPFGAARSGAATGRSLQGSMEVRRIVH
jgi:hypothetical protein